MGKIIILITSTLTESFISLRGILILSLSAIMAIINIIIAIITLIIIYRYTKYTKGIFEATKKNTEVIEQTYAKVFPALSFKERCIYSSSGSFSKDNKKWHFKFYIHNKQNIAGKFQIKFEFGQKENDEFQELFKEGNQQYKCLNGSNIFYRDDNRFYDIQTLEIMDFEQTLNEQEFLNLANHIYNANSIKFNSLKDFFKDAKSKEGGQTKIYIRIIIKAKSFWGEYDENTVYYRIFYFHVSENMGNIILKIVNSPSPS